MIKHHLLRTVLSSLVTFVILPQVAQAQIQYTPYDDLPGIIKSYKPAYSEDLPAWAKMLYEYPVNLSVITREFDQYLKQHPGERSPAIRYFRQWKRALESCAGADGLIIMPDLELYERNLSDARISAGNQSRPLPSGGPAWTFIGPRETFWLNESGSATAPASCPWQVNVYSFDVSASDNQVIYCGTETGYLNKTVNKGQTWQLAGQDYPFGGAITAVAVHPSDPDRVYVAAGNQVHLTTDGGISWTPLLPAGNRFYADRLKIDHANPLKMYAASANGVFVTTDGGLNWLKKWPAQAYDVEIKPDDNTKIYALAKSGTKFSVIMSSDGGQSFLAMQSFPNTYIESAGGMLAMTPANPDIILAILLCSGNTPYLLKGTLAGSAWTWALKATGRTSSFQMDNGQGYFDLALEISPLNENVILCGTTTLYRSVNGGSSFNAVGGYAGSYSIHPDIQDMKMLSNGETWVSTDGGMNLTTDHFSSHANYSVWVNGLIGSDFWGFDQGWNEDILVGGRYHNGNTALSDFYHPKALRMGGAESPTGWVLQGPSRHVAFNDLGNGWILPQSAEGQPEGRFIFSKYPNMDEYGGRRSNLVHHPNYYNKLYLGEGDGFWRSNDMGETWDLLHDFPGRVRYLQISFHNPNVFYADIDGYGLYRSADGGMSWQQKPSLTNAPYGNSNWKGKLFIAISPSDENVVYACLQNGTWSADLGKVFRSADGGNTWTNWTGTLSEYMKCIVVQPDAYGNDLVYLFTNSTNGKVARVYYRTSSMSNWGLFSDGYPAGMTVNMALPFFRDGKLHVGGNGGVWESRMADTLYRPYVNPWVQTDSCCLTDTLRFDDHSILDHSDVTWHWIITPQPAWIDNPDIRNPKVVLGNAGSYDVTLTVTRNGQNYSGTIAGMVTAASCPSIYDCDNPGELPKESWSLVYVDSEEIWYPGLAAMSFDNDPSTIWHTCWSTGDDPYPHEIRIDLGDRYRVSKFTYLTRQDGENGRINDYELYVSNDTSEWGSPVKTGQFVNTSAPQSVVPDSIKSGRYLRLVALSEVNGNPWASAAEFSVTGCVDWPTGIDPSKFHDDITAFPVPAEDFVNIPLPGGDRFDYLVVSSAGRVVVKGSIDTPEDTWRFSMQGLCGGVYLVRLTDGRGVYFIKVVKK